MSELIIYTKEGCPISKKVKDHYEQRGVEYKEINTSHDEEVRQYAKEKYGTEKGPVIVKNEGIKQSFILKL